MANVVVGVKKTSFTTKDTKETINGYNIYYSYPAIGVEGLATDRFFISLNKAGEWQPMPGDEILIYYNRFGKVDSVVLV